MKAKKFFSFLTGIAGIVGVSFVPSPANAAVNDCQHKIVEEVTEHTPVFLELAQSIGDSEGNLVAAHYSHRSHYSHSSHSSHTSHYSSRY